MYIILIVAIAGGLFSILSLIHFFADFVCQSHFEAMNKHNNPKIRALHCFTYTSAFLPMFWLFNFNLIEWLISINILFWSHFILDTYYFIMLWAKYIRRVPEFKRVGGPGNISEPDPKDDKEAFMLFVSTTLGKILLISVDQITHLICLLPIIYIIMRNYF